MSLWYINSIPTCHTIDYKDPISRQLISTFNLKLTSREFNPIRLKVKNIPITLIVIYGLYRSFDITCNGIFQHIVRQNQPCHIIISLDDDITEFDSEILNCFAEFRQNITILNTKITKKLRIHVMKEFELMERAMVWMEQSNIKFHYILKVRSDNFVQTNIHAALSYGNHSNFYHSYLKFQENLELIYRTHGRSNPSYSDCLFAWILTGGLIGYIKPMMITPSPSPWSLLNATAWNQNIYTYIQTHIQTREQTYEKINSQSDSQTHKHSHINSNNNNTNYFLFESKIRADLTDIHTRFEIVYLIGSTWIQYGRAETIRQCSTDILTHFGTLKWNITIEKSDNNKILPEILPKPFQWPKNAPFGDMKPNYLPNEWTDITESQLRLIHLKNHWNLIDLVNLPDYFQSFLLNEKYSLFQDLRNKELLVWILRICDKNINRLECLH